MSVRSRAGSRPSFPDSGRALPREQGALGAVLYGSLASFSLLLLELSLVLLVRGAEVSSIWEVQNGGVLLLPAYLALSIVGGAAGGLLLQLLLRSNFDSFRRRKLAPHRRQGIDVGIAIGLQLAGWQDLASQLSPGQFAVLGHPHFTRSAPPPASSVRTMPAASTE